MSEKHYPYYGGSFDRIIFDKDESVWVPEEENAKLRELLSMYVSFARKAAPSAIFQNFYPEGPGKRLSETEMRERALELGVKGCM